jgi:alginate O-acetyltransferase complex protein AlgJ
MTPSQAPWEDEHHGPMPILTRFIRDGKVARGKGGWLFLDNDSNDVMSQHAGTRTLSPDELEAWRVLLEERTTRLAEKQIPYFFLVAPDPQGVYPEMLPDGFVPTRERPIHKLLARFQEAESRARLIYPLDELVAGKPNRLAYSPFDTHWTEFGALVAYSRIMKDVRAVVPVRVIDPADISFTTRMMPGELRYKLGFDDDVEHLQAVFEVRALLVEDNEVEWTGAHLTLECAEAPPTTCVLFGDSYSLALLRFLGESFRRLVFVHSPWLDYELVEREQPDVVIRMLAERFLIIVPDDSQGATVNDLARTKRAEGLTRPRMPMWD